MSNASQRLAEMQRLLQSGHWREGFDHRSLQRGQAYAREQRVTELEPSRDAGNYVLEAKVRGQGKTYQTQVHLLGEGSRQQAMGLCSCPVHINCKHVVAILLTCLQHREPSITALESPQAVAQDDAGIEAAWHAWLQGVAGSRTGGQVPGQLEKERVLGLFVDVLDDHPLASLVVLPVWLRSSRSKSSRTGLVDPRPIGLVQHELRPVPPEGWPSTLEQRLRLLTQGRTRGALHRINALWTQIHQPHQVRALLELLDDEAVLFHEKQTGPRLNVGPQRHLSFGWYEESPGAQRLQACIGGGPAQCRIAEGGGRLWYLDDAAAEFGLLEGDPQLLARIDRAPALPADKAHWLQAQLQDLPELVERLPAPHQSVIEEAEPMAPGLRMHLRVVNLELAMFEILPLGCGEVTFEYGDAEVALDQPGDSVMTRHGEHLQRIPRDADAERELIRGLSSGMAPAQMAAEAVDMSDDAFGPGDLLLRLGDDNPRDAWDWPDYYGAPEDWEDMLETLRRDGVRLTFDEDFPQPPRRVAVDAWQAEVEPTDNGWFDLSLGIEVEGERQELMPILQDLLQNPRFSLEPAEDEPEDACWWFELDANRRLALPLSRLRELLAPILDWLREEPDPDRPLRLPVTQSEALSGLLEHGYWQGGERLREMASQLASLPTRLAAPDGFLAELRPYQQQGLAWLHFLASVGLGGILADDMGLGKTVQVLAHIVDEKRRGRMLSPVLVVVPTSLVGNWCAEAARFCPELNVLALQGDKARRHQALARLGEADIAITTYPLLARDAEALKEITYGLLVFDEAQAIKNPRSQAAQVVRELSAERRLAMTGTPLENHLGELWALVDAVVPGLLGTPRWFTKHYRTPIEKHGDDERRRRLSRRIAPLMLRRRKDEVLSELPAKTESLRRLTLSGAQRELYESLRLAQHQRVQQAIAERGLARSGIVVLDALLKLRQVCCDPRLIKLDSARRVTRSVKLEALLELLDGLLNEGRRVLVFSQFTTMLALIGEALSQRGIPFLTLTGQTQASERSARVASFQEGETPLFLVSLKAGGVGLNLTAADSVIHYDPWWNPAVEAQATDRAHRIGQDKPVFVYKLVCADTVEEKIAELQVRKAGLAQALLERESGQEESELRFDEGDLEALFAPLG